MLTEKEIKDIVIDQIKKQFPSYKGQINRETRYDKKGLDADSLETVFFVMDLSDEMKKRGYEKFEIPDEEVSRQKTVGHTIDYLVKVLNNDSTIKAKL